MAQDLIKLEFIGFIAQVKTHNKLFLKALVLFCMKNHHQALIQKNFLEFVIKPFKTNLNQGMRVLY